VDIIEDVRPFHESEEESASRKKKRKKDSKKAGRETTPLRSNVKA
jgi:hypothetical protein